jgi:penicillin-insensitive murein DD-endopeptidase
MKKYFLLLFVFSQISYGSNFDPQFSLWEKPREPLAGDPEAIGAYSAGCIAGAKPLKLDGAGYSVMRVSRKRFYGHPTLLEYIENLGVAAKKEKLPTLLVGDLGQARGGPMISGHSSHQTGLDVDIWYRMEKRRPSKREREKWEAPVYVTRDGMKVSKAWTKKHKKLVELSAQSENVDRIFVHAAIKKDFCQSHPDAPWLYKLRPWWGHDDHLHVRLKCPKENPECKGQEPLELVGAQCGTELDWWFSAEAKEEWGKKREAHGRVFPQMPKSCDRMIEESLAQSEKNLP